VVIVDATAAFDVVNRASGFGDPWLPSIASAALAFGIVGALIASRRSPSK
jgi:hypothetical protein